MARAEGQKNPARLRPDGVRPSGTPREIPSVHDGALACVWPDYSPDLGSVNARLATRRRPTSGLALWRGSLARRSRAANPRMSSSPSTTRCPAAAARPSPGFAAVGLAAWRCLRGPAQSISDMREWRATAELGTGFRASLVSGSDIASGCWLPAGGQAVVCRGSQ
jgi:hypothetical protein